MKIVLAGNSWTTKVSVRASCFQSVFYLYLLCYDYFGKEKIKSYAADRSFRKWSLSFQHPLRTYGFVLDLFVLMHYNIILSDFISVNEILKIKIK